MAAHREEGRFVVRIELSGEFDEAYEGDDDGYAWLRRWHERVRPRLARMILDELRADPGFDAIPASRGVNPDDGLEVAVRFKPAKGRAPG
ncbi:MAG TPA: hypothetical protein VGY54_22410 [Polyangiaceae bacterium]|jgi:hypothetical protein|nr:hypothetical protein [Polyangiaceae bacterium]